MAAPAGANRLIKRPKAKTERIEFAPHNLTSVLMWCDGGTAPIGSGFTINHIGGTMGPRPRKSASGGVGEIAVRQALRAFARGSVLAVLPCANAIGHLDRNFCRLNDRWTCPRTLGWRHDVLFGRAAWRCRRFRGIVAGVASVGLTTGTEGESEMIDRTRAPKAEDYSVVPGSVGPRRDFRISVGLREGWDPDGRVFDVSEAVRTARAWMKRRVEAGQPALSGMFTRAEVTYAWPRPDGTVGSDREPVALFTGEAVHAYLGHLPDEAIVAMLNELSIELGAALGQERIYVAFADRTWILDAGEH